ncbi:50S ribosomal subunit L7/L12 [Candidatus Hodgkinia cicadicola]|nr:MAG: putative 50S ribosomal subunit L7/L12 [Candidatus Hodgkinia cicadicola]PIM96569.1 50S ribosomal subunit L7/L12 [Candidatus Hodgkinia cicadicola]PIM96666.1 50S ribosomal subunit L7/L12 [Candidatus Hodgkinia cicadicola]
MNKITEIFNMITGLKVTELMELIKLLELTWNTGTTKQTDQSHHVDLVNNKRYNVRLISIGKNKINIIKEIKNLLNIGLKESRDLIEVLPKMIKEQIEKHEADTIKKKLELLDATVEIS